MGLSSSQARLLSLTGRMHDIEFKAQKLEAQKLQMANESTRAYEDYLNALDMSKIQLRKISAETSDLFIDANLSNLNDDMYLKNIYNNKTYITSSKASKYNLDETVDVSSLEAFMSNAGFNKICDGYNFTANSNITDNYQYLSNTVQDNGVRTVPNFKDSVGYQNVTSKNTSAYEVIGASTTNFVKGQTYCINDAAGLQKLADLTKSGIATEGVNFILGGNIDMSSITNWSGIGSYGAGGSNIAFKGNFDGNGYKISNLKGSTGLFDYVVGDQVSNTDATTGVTTTSTYGKIENVIIENCDITYNKTSTGLGALVGKADSANITNCFTQGKIQGNNWTGGLVGWNTNSAISNSSANVDITAIGTCDGGFVGHDTNGVISNCTSQGSVTSTGNQGYLGGFIGHETSNGSTFIYNCATTTSISGSSSRFGAFIGVIDSGCAANVVGCSYSSTICETTVGSGIDSMTSSGSDESLSDGATRNVTTTYVILPSKSEIISNISALFYETGKSVDNNQITNFVDSLYEVDAKFASEGILTENALKLASINKYIVNGSDKNDLAANLKKDIENNQLTNTAKYQKEYEATKDYEYTAKSSNGTDKAKVTTAVQIPSINNVANNLYTILKNNNYPVSTVEDVADIQAWMTDNYDTKNVELANLNQYLENVNNGTADKSELANIYNAFNNKTAYTLNSKFNTYPSNKSNIISSVNVTQVAEAQDTTGIHFDLNDSEVVEAIEFYNVIEEGYIVVDDENSTSATWLRNMITSANAILVEYDKNNQTFTETSVATNTNLQEVVDETLIKKAEAKYEAEMKRIDRKDTKYDTDLAALETERNAIKQEIETLKTVAKENVERTFKLFS